MRKIFLAFLAGASALANAQYNVSVGQNNRYAVVELSSQEWTNWNDNDAFNDATSRENITKELYTHFDDDFDFIFFLLNNQDRPQSLSYTGQLIQVSNNVTGIGSSMSVFDNSGDYGSNGKLQAVMILTKYSDLLLGPALHELAHNWANFALPTKDYHPSFGEYSSMPHWGFTGCGGQLGGFAQSELETNVDGNPNKYKGLINGDVFGGFANGGPSVEYSNFELYLMGMIPESQITSFDAFSGITSMDYQTGVFEASTKTTYDKTSLINLLGSRSPSSATSQKDFKILVAVLTESGLTTQEKTDFDYHTENFDREGPTDYNQSQGGGYHNFYTATGQRGTVDLDLSNSIVSVDPVQLETKVSLSEFFPNPSSQLTGVTFEAKESLELKFSVYDIAGKVVHTEQISVAKGAGTFAFDISDLSSGTYVSKFESMDGSTQPVSKTLVVKK